MVFASRSQKSVNCLFCCNFACVNGAGCGLNCGIDRPLCLIKCDNIVYTVVQASVVRHVIMCFQWYQLECISIASNHYLNLEKQLKHYFHILLLIGMYLGSWSLILSSLVVEISTYLLVHASTFPELHLMIFDALHTVHDNSRWLSVDAQGRILTTSMEWNILQQVTTMSNC